MTRAARLAKVCRVEVLPQREAVRPIALSVDENEVVGHRRVVAPAQPVE
jgi:hypothetical protein